MGCGGSKNLRNSSITAPTRSDGATHSGSDNGEADAEQGGDVLYPTEAEIDSFFVGTEWLLDSLAVSVDSLSSPGAFGTDLPDISDSLAAATQARLPSVEEIFDYPVVVNRRVLVWIDLYLGRAKDTFQRSLKRSGHYLAMARRIFAEEGVPQDLTFLAHVESGFRYNARSPKRALGLWQFMRGTARIYGLRCDAYVDERLDPEKSTRASARLLRDLYERYDDWYLALAAYNAGSGKVNRAIRRAGSRDFWRIAQTRYLRNETRNFVPAILAVTILAKSPGAYGLTEETYPPLEYDTVPVHSPTDLRVIAGCIDASLAELQDLNPSLLLMQTPLKAKGFEVHVPKRMGETCARELAKIPPEKCLVFHRHKVRRGQTLGLLARRYGTTVRAIQDANGMGRRTMIRIGQVLRIPSRYAGVAYLVDPDREGTAKHIVRRGDTLSEIAQYYGVTLRQVQEANAIVNRSRIYTGQTLLIPPSRKRPGHAAPSRSLAQSTGNALGHAEESLAQRSSAEPSQEADEFSDQTGPSNPSPSGTRTLRAMNSSSSLGRVPTTVHIVEQAREAIKREGHAASTRSLGVEQPHIHVVRRGDTLSEIAERYRVRLSDLRRWNDLGRRSIIHPRQELVVGNPQNCEHREGARLHVVRRGESLWRIAKRYGVRVTDLAGWNSLHASATIYPGQKLRVY